MAASCFRGLCWLSHHGDKIILLSLCVALLEGDRGKHSAYLIFTSFQLRFSRSGVMTISNPLIRTNERNQSERSPLEKHDQVFRRDVNEICTLLIILLFFVRSFWRNEGFYYEACRWNLVGCHTKRNEWNCDPATRPQMFQSSYKTPLGFHRCATRSSDSLK